MEARLSRLEGMLTFPDHYGLRMHQIEPLRKEYETLSKEYLSLPPEVKQLQDIYLKTRVTYESDNGHYRIVHNWGRWNLYDGTEYIKDAKIDFVNGKPVKVTFPHVGSETHGKIVQYTFNIILDEEKPKPVEIPRRVSGFKLPSPEEVRKQLQDSLGEDVARIKDIGPVNTILAIKDSNVALVKRGKADNNFITRWLRRKQ